MQAIASGAGKEKRNMGKSYCHHEPNRLRTDKENGYVQFKEKDGFWYLLDSIHPKHLKKF